MDKRLMIGMALLLCFFCVKAQRNILFESSIRPIVKVDINGVDAYMLIDTGSSINVISVQAVSRHKLRVRTSYAGTLYSATNQVNAKHVDKARIEIAGKPFYQFVMIDISVIATNILFATGIEISGIIGTPGIKDLGIVIDLKQGIITIK